jgi:hypothetical protein
MAQQAGRIFRAEFLTPGTHRGLKPEPSDRNYVIPDVTGI